MKKRGLFIAIGLLVLVNVVVLGGAAFNRAGEPDAVMTLTDREMPLATGQLYQENSGVSLRINTYHATYLVPETDDNGTSPWLDRKKLESLGFRFDKRSTEDEKNDTYERQMPRRTFAVLEFDGTAWDAWKKALEEKLSSLDNQGKEEGKRSRSSASKKDIERELTNGSRLFVIDAGNDPALLRNRYTDRAHYLIIPAIARVSYYGSYASQVGSKLNISGYIELLINEVNVPHRLHNKIGNRQFPNTVRARPSVNSENSLHYDVVLQSGKRYEPWIADIISR